MFVVHCCLLVVELMNVGDALLLVVAANECW
jgi:hypothetical protein